MTTVIERATATANRRLYPGTIFNIRVSAEEINNAIVISDYEAIPGSEPPRHVHTIEDEVFIIKEGALHFSVVMILSRLSPAILYFCPSMYHIILRSLLKK